MLAGRIAQNIQAMREKRGWSRPDLGKRCQPPTSGQQIERLEKGMRTLSVDWIERVARGFGVDPADLLVGEAFELTPQVAEMVAASLGRVVLRGDEPDPAIVGDLGVLLRELFELFARHESMRRDPEAVRPVIDVLTR
jgi:transcriptional regulator with XRE-family HTH domain